MHRAVARNSRLLRRYRFDGLLRNAEAADFHNRVDQLFFLLRRHAPKQPRKRAQLRSSTGALLMPQAEAKELATYWKEVTTADTPTKAPIPLPFDISQEAVQQAIASLPSKKAAPAHYAPHALWTCAASSVAEVLERGLLQAWRQDEASIPDAWADAWLTFLQKPNKAGNSPQHLRPIALLDPVGKAVTGILRQQLDTHILPHMVTQHQYGFLPSRSVQQALGRAFMHCRAVRDLCQAQRRSLYEQKAFDRVSRGLLEAALIYIGVLGNDWCRQHQVGYADDNLFQWTFRSREEVTQAIHEAGIIIEVFEGHGLMVSKDKTAVLLRLAGPQATALRRKITKRVEGQSHLVLGPDLTLPLKAKHVYLGAIISFDRFEEYTADHRCQAGIATYHRLRKHLHSKRAWPLHKRIRLWKAYVLPTVFYALTASGLTSNGAARLRIELVRQLRAIAGRPRHITLESDAQFMSSIGVEPPLQALVQRQQRVLEKTRSLQGRLSAQDVRLDPALLAHETNILQHFQELVQPSNTTGAGADLPCPDCGQRFPTEASLRQHRAVVHRRGENKPRAERFDRLLHGQDGLPQCINCGHKFRLWEELQRHVELGRCQAPARADYDDVHPPLLAKVLQNEIVFPDVLLSPPGEDLKQELKERCAICRTWLPNENYMKVHYGMTWFVNGGPPERVDMTGTMATTADEELMDVFKGGKGKGGRKDNDNRGTWNHWERNSWDSSTWRPQRRPELDQLVEALCRLSLKQEEELQLLRTEKQFLLHMESGPQGLLHPLWKVAQAWKVGKDKTPPTVTSSLRVALIKCMLAEWAARLDLMTKNEETLKKMEAQGWVKVQGENEPMWNYQQWNAQSRRLELDP
ncbi:unnamed protein product, partial [Symbiodinium sp. KB8]